MKRKYALFAVVFVVLLLIGIQVVEVVDANPFLPIPTSPPDTAVVSLKVLSPKENASYTNGTINVCFIKEINSISGVRTSVNPVSTYQGDWMNSSKWCPFPPSEEGKNWLDYQVLQHNFTLTQIPKGYHTLTIDARGGGDYNANGSMYTFQVPKETVTISFFMDSSPVNGSQIINQVSSPTPSHSMPTINTGAALPVELNPSIVYITLAIVVALIAVASIILVFLKKHKRNAV